MIAIAVALDDWAALLVAVAIALAVVVSMVRGITVRLRDERKPRE